MLRKEAKLTQEEASEILQISTRHFARYESGQQKMNIWQFKSYMEALGQPSEDYWLMYLDTEEFEE